MKYSSDLGYVEEKPEWGVTIFSSTPIYDCNTQGRYEGYDEFREAEYYRKKREFVQKKILKALRSLPSNRSHTLCEIVNASLALNKLPKYEITDCIQDLVLSKTIKEIPIKSPAKYSRTQYKYRLIEK